MICRDKLGAKTHKETRFLLTALCQLLAEAPPGARREALLWAHAPRIAADAGLATRLLEQPSAGRAWHADHILPVHSGGGECTTRNAQCLCVACHKDKTRRESQRRERPQRAKKARAARAACAS